MMKSRTFLKSLVFCVLILLLNSTVFSQRRAKPRTPTKSKPIVFAVISDGERIEPIGEIDKGELVPAVNGDAEEKSLLSFLQNYYKPKTTYNLIFGAAKNGSVTIVNSNPKSDCGKNAASVKIQSTKAKLKGFVMGLATNHAPVKTASGLRRLPTAAERAEIEALVRAEFIKQSVSADAAKNLKYYNLTALDVDNDKKPEMVGSYWVENSAKERNQLFFIAEIVGGNKYQFGHSQYQKITPDDLMSGELKDLDELGGELLLDAMEFDGDSTAEIFTVAKAFEGYNYYVYSRRDGKWTKVYENYNYHCAY
jgi:hypothetical protein